MPNLLESLRLKISEAGSSQQIAEARALYAINLARFGRIDEASTIINQLRTSFPSGISLRISLLIIILDAAIIFFSERSVSSFDRIKRAHILASRFSMSDLRLTSAAWAAHMAFNFHDYTVMGEMLNECVAAIGDVDIAVRSRVCVVIADAYQYVGNWELAENWYQCARLFARACHDHASISSIEYNRVAIGMDRLRVESHISGERKTVSMRNWRLEVESVVNLHAGMNDRSLLSLLDLIRLRWFELSGQFEAASEVISSLLASGAADQCGLSDTILRIEMLWCQMKSGISVDGGQIPQLSIDELENLDSDDRIDILAKWLELSSAGDVPETDSLLRSQRDSAINEYFRDVEAISNCLSPLQSSFHIIRSEAEGTQSWGDA